MIPAADKTSSAQQRTQHSFRVPHISNDDLSAFVQAHFSEEAISEFGQVFFNPFSEPVIHSSQQGDDDWEEDDLGYYDDGVKRTLTDEQIAIFRHSELKDLRRQQGKNEVKAQKESMRSSDEVNKDPEESAQLKKLTLPSNFRNSKIVKKRKSGIVRPKAEAKPDLRKRTWDVVDKGLDSLDYD